MRYPRARLERPRRRMARGGPCTANSSTHSVAGHEGAPAGTGVAHGLPERLVLPGPADRAAGDRPLRRAAIRPASPGAALREHGGARAGGAAAPGKWRHVPTILLAASLVLLTTAMAGPTSDVRIPLNRAVVMLVIDVSESMASTDVPPNRLAAAKEAGKQFADQLTPAINLGLVEFAANATLLVPPTTNRGAVKAGIDSLKPTPENRHRGRHFHRAAGDRDGGFGDGRRRRSAAGADRAGVRRRRERAAGPQRPAGGVHRGPRRQGRGRADLDDLVRHPVRHRRLRGRHHPGSRSTTRPCRRSARSPTASRSTPTAWSR